MPAGGNSLSARARGKNVQSLGEYQLLSRLAVGGIGEIHLATRKGPAGFQKLVVIKRLRPHLETEEELVQNFLLEAQYAAAMRHQNICQTFHLGEEGQGNYYIAMEYLEGLALSALRKDAENKLPVRVVGALISQACEGLHYAHSFRSPDGSEVSVIHRDVSPQNLFLTVDGVVKVLDFGLATSSDRALQDRAVRGKSAYMSPEQTRAEVLTPSSDIFSLGVVAYELLTGSRLFQRDSRAASRKAVNEDTIPFAQSIEPAIRTVILKATERNPNDRFQTAREFGAAIREALEDEGGALSQVELSRWFESAYSQRIQDRRDHVADLMHQRAPETKTDIELVWPASTGLTSISELSEEDIRKTSVSWHFEEESHHTESVGKDSGVRMQKPSAAIPLPLQPSVSQQLRGSSNAETTRTRKVAYRENDEKTLLRGATPSNVQGHDLPSQASQPIAYNDESDSLGAWAVDARSAHGSEHAIGSPGVSPSPRRSKGLILFAGISLLALAIFFAIPGASDDSEQGRSEVVEGKDSADQKVPPGVQTEVALAAPEVEKETEAATEAETETEAAAETETEAESETEEAVLAPDEELGGEQRPEPVPEDDEPARRGVRPKPTRSPDKGAGKRDVATPTGKKPGFLTVDASPYATIYVNGRSLGQTPLYRASLPPGRYKVKAVSKHGDIKRFQVTILSGKEAPRRRLVW